MYIGSYVGRKTERKSNQHGEGITQTIPLFNKNLWLLLETLDDGFMTLTGLGLDVHKLIFQTSNFV